MPIASVFQLIYVSSATRHFSEDELLELLEQSRERNERQAVTGMLLFAGGNFIQILEGSKDDVKDIYASIQNDDRNTGNIIYEEREVSERVFKGWWMGFKNLGDRPLEISGYTDLMNNNVALEQFTRKRDAIIDLLYSFKLDNQRS